MASSPVMAMLAFAMAAETAVAAETADASADPWATLRAPIREDQHPRYLDADDHAVKWSDIRPIARQTDVMARVRKRQLGRVTLQVVFSAAAAAEVWGTVALVERESDWAWPLGAQAGLTALAAGLLWSEIPRSRRIDRAEMLEASNAWLRTRP